MYHRHAGDPGFLQMHRCCCGASYFENIAHSTFIAQLSHLLLLCRVRRTLERSPSRFAAADVDVSLALRALDRSCARVLRQPHRVYFGGAMPVATFYMFTRFEIFEAI